MADVLNLVKVPLRAGPLMVMARRKHIPARDSDDGYLAHCVMRELWGDDAPAPFLLRGRGAIFEAWGYSPCAASVLVQRARENGLAAASIVPDLEGIQSRAIPVFEPGRRLGFGVRCCPVVRLASPTHGHERGAEVDAFLARCFSAGDDAEVSREAVYRNWLAVRLADTATTGVRVEYVRVAAMCRQRMVRRTQGHDRRAARIERPDVRFEGVLTVCDSGLFLDVLRRGVGRHRAFGFGALMLGSAGSSFSG